MLPETWQYHSVCNLTRPRRTSSQKMFTKRFAPFLLLGCLVGYGMTQSYPQYNQRSSQFGSYSQDYQTSQSQCTRDRQCHEYMLVLSVTGGSALTGNATKFRQHYQNAGFNREAMIQEGRRAAWTLKRQYGVDVTNLAGETYLAPSVKLSNGVTFNFVTVSPIVYMGARRDQTQLYNIPASVGWWNIDFSEDYKSTGTFRGTIPAGARVYYGSLLVDTCPNESPYNPCNSVLSNKPKGQVFIRFYTESYNVEVTPGPFVRIDSVLEHEEWGRGRARGLFVTNEATGLTNGNEVHVFPEVCDRNAKCYAQA